MPAMRRRAGIAFCIFGTVTLLLATAMAGWAWAAATAADPVLPSSVVASEPTSSGEICQSSHCVEVSRSELLLDHNQMLKRERRMVLKGFVALLGVGLLLIGFGTLLISQTSVAGRNS